MKSNKLFIPALFDEMSTFANSENDGIYSKTILKTKLCFRNNNHGFIYTSTMTDFVAGIASDQDFQDLETWCIDNDHCIYMDEKYFYFNSEIFERSILDSVDSTFNLSLILHPDLMESFEVMNKLKFKSNTNYCYYTPNFWRREEWQLKNSSV